MNEIIMIGTDRLGGIVSTIDEHKDYFLSSASYVCLWVGVPYNISNVALDLNYSNRKLDVRL
jgi:hypothetical protein